MLDIEKNLNTFPALWRLRALLPAGLQDVPASILSALERDDYSQALKLGNQRYAARRGEDYNAALIYACLLVGRELVVEARGVLGTVLKSYPGDRALSALLADALVIEGEVGRAIEVLAKLSTSNDSSPGYTNLSPGTAAYIADIYLDVADEEPTAEARALQLYQWALEHQTPDPEPAIRLSQLYLDLDEFYAAAEALEYAARLFKNRPQTWDMVADLWLEAGEESRSLRARSRAMKFAEPEPEIDEWLALAFEFAQASEFDDALVHIGRVEQMLHESVRSPSIDALFAQTQLLRGNIHLELYQLEEAISALHAVEERVGEHPIAQRRLAEAALKLGDLDLADTHARRATTLEPDNPEAWFFLARVHQALGMHAEAMDTFQRALSNQPDDPLWLSFLAISQYFLGDLIAAKSTLTRAADQLQTNPEHPALTALDTTTWERIIKQLKAANSPEASWFEETIALLTRT